MNKVPFHSPVTPLAGPIALVTTIDGEGRVNVAPMSWISHICRKPLLLVLGSHRSHHTVQNLLANGECVLNFPADDLAGQTWGAHHYL
ncbi:MAG TPA: flavin reductase, partial [Symbiobacteriaceae bacterium]|nr:flavin reductase [Symbiobacteriaceae bacterium]